MSSKPKSILQHIVAIYGVIVTIILGVTIFIFNNNQNQSNNIDNPPIVGLGVSCPTNLPSVEGNTWRGITINESRLLDLQNLYGVIASRSEPVQRSSSSFTNVYTISLTRESAETRNIAQGVKVCLLDNKISALYLSVGFDSELPDADYNSWIVRYGNPDIVTWSSSRNWNNRMAIWSAEGVAVDIDIIYLDEDRVTAFVNGVLFFPPTVDNPSLETFPFNWLQQDAPDTTPPIEGLSVENPFE